MLEPGNPWNGHIRAIGTYITGAELERSSVVDYTRYDPGPGPRLAGARGLWNI